MLDTRVYGDRGPTVLVLHGGPGAPGHMAPVARGLSHRFRVVEPMQRRSGAAPLSVARHVADLHELVDAHTRAAPLALVGSSWGAMLALAYAAAHPAAALPLVLIGSGTFDPAARTRMREILDAGRDEAFCAELARIEREIPDPDERLGARADLVVERQYFVDPLPAQDGDDLPMDADGHREAWADMVRLQDEGLYPAAFAVIQGPVLMLHGAQDPHPGRMIRDGLLPHVPQLEYVEWDDCGHYPWRERRIRDTFFERLETWLADKLES